MHLSPLPQGYLVGNGCTDPEYDGNALPPFAVGKSLISQVRFVGSWGGGYYGVGSHIAHLIFNFVIQAQKITRVILTACAS